MLTSISDFFQIQFHNILLFKIELAITPDLERLWLVWLHVIPTVEVGSTSQCDCFKTSLQTTSHTATNWGEEFAASFYADSGEGGMILHDL